MRLRRIFVFCLTLCALMGILLWFFQQTYIIRFVNKTQERIFFKQRIQQGNRFTFRYIHSVQKTPVYEIFTIDKKGDVILVETRVMSLGYGLPAPTRKDDRVIENDFFVIRNLNKRIGNLLIRVNFIRPMELIFGKTVFDLRDCGQAGDLIEVSVIPKKKITAIMGILQGEESRGREHD